METNELQEMRDQMSLLKETLQKEQIVNDRLLRDAMRGKVKTIHRNVWIVGACTLYVMTFGVWAFHYCGFSWWLIGFTMLVMIYSITDTILIHRRLRSDCVLTDDLRTVTLAARKLKQDYIDSLKRAIPLTIAMTGWFAGELLFGHTIYSDTPLVGRLIVTAVMLVSCGIGFWIGYRMHRRVLDLCDEIVNGLED